MKIYGRSLSQAVSLREINSIYEYYLNTLNNYLWFIFMCAVIFIVFASFLAFMNSHEGWRSFGENCEGSWTFSLTINFKEPHSTSPRPPNAMLMTGSKEGINHVSLHDNIKNWTYIKFNALIYESLQLFVLWWKWDEEFSSSSSMALSICCITCETRGNEKQYKIKCFVSLLFSPL